MGSKLKTEMLRLPMTFIGGEQKNDVTIPFDNFSTVDDADFLQQVENDKRTEKIIYAYTDSGISENGRNWSPDVMTSIASQVIDKMPVGYLGHIKPKDYGFKFPEPQIVWFGSYTETLTNDSIRLWIKGYLLPTAKKLEVWIKTKAVDSISVYGKISYTMEEDIMNIQTVDLKSIDIARKLGEGLNSGIAGLYGEMNEDVASEMEATYERIRESICSSMRSVLKENPAQFGFTVVRPVNINDSGPYSYAWVRDMYIDSPTAIVSMEYNNVCKLFEVGYTYDDDSVTVTSFTEVVEERKYTAKKDGASETNTDITAGEMAGKFIKKEEKVMPNITVADVMADKNLVNELRTQFATEMATEQSQKEMISKAGEMDKILGIIGGEMEGLSERVKSIAAFNARFVGEMSAIFAGEGEELEPDEIVEKTQAAVDTVAAVRDAVGANEDEDVVEKVQDAVDANAAAAATVAIAEVNKAFEDKIAELDDETLAEFVRDDFADIVGLNPDDVDDAETFRTNALKEIEDNFDAVVKKYSDRLAKVGHKKTAVGEMNAMQRLGTFTTSKKAADSDEDPDIAAAKALGYGEDSGK